MPVITPVSSVRRSPALADRDAFGPVAIDEWDRLVGPRPSVRVADVRLRSRVAIRGVVLDARSVRWAGGPVLEVVVSDGSGEICLGFLGRWRIGGVVRGRELSAAGTVASRLGRRVMLNPIYWLHESALEVVADA